MTSLDQVVQDWSASHGYELLKLSIIGREIWRIQIRDGTRDDVIDIWQQAAEGDSSIAIDYTSGRTSICKALNCSLLTLVSALDDLNRYSVDVDHFADSGLS